MPNLLDLMSPEDRETVAKWKVERQQTARAKEIPPGLLLCAKLGYYYGWEAVVDFRRGYHLGLDDFGNWTRLGFTPEDAEALVDAAERVHYRLKLHEGRINAANSVSSTDKDWANSNAAWVNRLAKEV